jgi:hypothetical protein
VPDPWEMVSGCLVWPFCFAFGRVLSFSGLSAAVETMAEFFTRLSSSTSSMLGVPDFASFAVAEVGVLMFVQRC